MNKKRKKKKITLIKEIKINFKLKKKKIIIPKKINKIFNNQL